MDFDSKLNWLVEKCISGQDTFTRDKSLLALRDFKEKLNSLERRYQELNNIEDRFFKATWDHTEDTRLLQPIFIDKLESYYQQVYAAESAFIKLLSHVAAHNFMRGINFSSIDATITELKKRHGLTVHNLLRALEYRTRVDHPQIKGTFDYLTFTSPQGQLRCIFFNPSKSEPLPLDIIEEMGMPSIVSAPVNGGQWFTPPHHKVVQLEIHKFFIDVLKVNLAIPIV